MFEITNPYTGAVVGEVRRWTAAELTRAIDDADRFRRDAPWMPGHRRAEAMHSAADMLDADQETLAQLISAETGKPITEARSEASRAGWLLRLCAFEGTQIRGESLPLDSAPNGVGCLGFTVNQPAGIVAAITPFNYPCLLVLHKIGPALAAGNMVILKPAESTPLTAHYLADILIAAGFPEASMVVATGSGHELGPVLCSDPRIRVLSFTGSTDVGRQITAAAGLKRLSLELGSNSPMVVLADADVDAAARSALVGGFTNSGQVCLSVQRIYVERPLIASFLDRLTPMVKALRMGAPEETETQLSCVINEAAARRIGDSLDDAVARGAELIVGGGVDGAVVEPTILTNVDPSAAVCRDELFGPAVAVIAIEDLADAIVHANASQFGLAAGIFTADITRAMNFAMAVDAGTVQINNSPLWRADLIPYGGHKDSGIGKEGPRYAVQSMVETKTVVVHGVETSS